MTIKQLKESVLEHLESIQYEIKESGIEESDFGENDGFLDVRLRLQPDRSFTVLYGDPSYDTDHRGFWGTSSIAVDTDLDTVADDLVEQALDDQAQSQSDLVTAIDNTVIGKIFKKGI